MNVLGCRIEQCNHAHSCRVLVAVLLKVLVRLLLERSQRREVGVLLSLLALEALGIESALQLLEVALLVKVAAHLVQEGEHGREGQLARILDGLEARLPGRNVVGREHEVQARQALQSNTTACQELRKSFSVGEIDRPTDRPTNQPEHEP